MEAIKKHFPIFRHQKDLIYLDSAATTQTPQVVIDALTAYYTNYRANVHRGFYALATKATNAYESARDSVAHLIKAKREEIIFTSGTTMGLNSLAYSLSPRLSHRDNVVLTRLEHHANLVPWQEMAKHYGFELRFIELKKYELDLESAKKLIDANTKIVSFTLVSNVLGNITPAEELIRLVRQKAPRALAIVDAAQAIAHLPIDVKKLDCDFLVFSGHKMYGPTGSGALYGKKMLLDEHLEPFFFGGEMVRSVSYESADWMPSPHKFEAGTPNIAGAIGLGAAADFIMKLGWKKIQNHESELTAHALKKLKNEVTIIGPVRNRIGVIAFTIPGVHPHDIADILNQKKICLRAGYHCAEPLHHYLNISATARASFGIYTTKKEIDALAKGIQKIKKMFL